MNKKAFPYIFLFALAILVLVIKNCRTNTTSNNDNKSTKEQRGLNRNPSQINYSKHAVCRMDCRQITKAEVNEILTEGTINYKKSDISKHECSRRYAVEGYSKDSQHLRIVFAPCNNEVTVVTCIDLNKDWECHCEGDE